MTDELTDRRSILKTTGAALAGLTGAAGAASADPGTECVGCGGGGGTPSVSTGYAAVNGSHVTTNGWAGTGSTDKSSYWFEFGEQGNGLPNDTYLQYGTGGSFCDGYDSSCPNDSYGSLSSGTYEYRAVAYNDYGRSEGSIRTFTI